MNADFLPAMHAPLQPEPLPIMFAGPEPTEADERKDKPLYQLESIVPAWTKTTWALLSILTALCVVLVIVMVQGLN